MTDRGSADLKALLESQRTYYDLRAPDYMNAFKPDRRGLGFMEAEQGRALIAEFRPGGHVLEFACGPGVYTADLARHAETLTAVDASPTMLEIAQRRTSDPKVTFVRADIFRWRPDRAYDAVFFGAWLSHVPLSAFDDFWTLVRSCLAPGGRVAFIDEDDRATIHDDRLQVAGTPAARRTLRDGRQFDIVKVFWNPNDLEERLRSSGWDMTVRPVGESFLYGVGRDVEA